MPLRPPNLPLQVLNTNLLPCLLIIVEPILTNIHILELSARFLALTKPAALLRLEILKFTATEFDRDDVLPGGGGLGNIRVGSGLDMR